MFDLADRPVAWIEVAWPGLAAGEDEGLGVEVTHKIELLVEIVDRDVMAEIYPTFMGEEGEGKDQPSDVDILMRVVRDWRQAGGGKKLLDNGVEVPFNRENCAKLCAVPLFGPNFTASYIAATGGKARIREGNSERSPSGGRAAGPKPARTTKRKRGSRGSAKP